MFGYKGDCVLKTSQIITWINNGELWRFYKTQDWIKLKKQILDENHYECRECKKHGILTRYDVDKNGNRKLISTVHHVQFVRKHPELALSRTYIYKGKTYDNLIPVCKSCHNKLHPEKNKNRNNKNSCEENSFKNEERW